jgi:hypothetical protein
MPDISPRTRFSLTLAAGLGLGLGLLKIGWTGAMFLRDIRDEIGSLRGEVKALTDDRWTLSDMERWAAKLERANRQTVPPLVVPEAGSARKP